MSPTRDTGETEHFLQAERAFGESRHLGTAKKPKLENNAAKARTIASRTSLECAFYRGCSCPFRHMTTLLHALAGNSLKEISR
jgi:hypothetical protein